MIATRQQGARYSTRSSQYSPPSGASLEQQFNDSPHDPGPRDCGTDLEDENSPLQLLHSAEVNTLIANLLHPYACHHPLGRKGQQPVVNL